VAIFIGGLGHIIIGQKKRGIGILVIDYAQAFLIGWLVSFPVSLIWLGFHIWQLHDLYKIMKALR
jgi:hypothetical protein